MKKRVIIGITVVIIITLLGIGLRLKQTSSTEHDHDHDGGSITEALIYRGTCEVSGHQVELRYSDTIGDIVDVAITVESNGEDLVELSRNNQLSPDLDPPLYEQVDRVVQYMVGFNKYPPVNADGTSDDLITLTINLKELETCYDNAEEE